MPVTQSLAYSYQVYFLTDAHGGVSPEAHDPGWHYIPYLDGKQRGLLWTRVWEGLASTINFVNAEHRGTTGLAWRSPGKPSIEQLTVFRVGSFLGAGWVLSRLFLITHCC